MAAPRDYRELRVWERGHAIALRAYLVTRSFPKEEQYGLTSQIRRSASSVPANIAEGCGRGGGDLSRFCKIAQGSAMELDYHLLLAKDLALVEEETYQSFASEVVMFRQMHGKFISRLDEQP